jgi:chromosome partitioning protein
MGHVLAFAMNKGGVAKTTTVLNVGAILAERGARVLLVDIDPQGDLTEGLGMADDPTIEYSAYEVLLNPQHGTAFATVHTKAGFDLIPSTFHMSGAELELAGRVGRELLLRKALRETRHAYDYILIDPPPGLGLFMLNALAAADAAIVPIQTHKYAYNKLPQLEATIDLIKELNSPLHIGGVICTLVDRTNYSQGIEQRIRTHYREVVFHTTIPRLTAIAEAPAAGEPVTIYAPGTRGAQAYRELTNELEARYGR